MSALHHPDPWRSAMDRELQRIKERLAEQTRKLDVAEQRAIAAGVIRPRGDRGGRAS